MSSLSKTGVVARITLEPSRVTPVMVTGVPLEVTLKAEIGGNEELRTVS